MGSLDKTVYSLASAPRDSSNPICSRIMGLQDGETAFVSETSENTEILAKLENLKAEHRDLDYAIATLGEQAHFDQLQVQRLKKRKLKLKDLIDRLEAGETPDIIA